MISYNLDNFRFYDDTLTLAKYLKIKDALEELTCKMPAYAEKYARKGDSGGKLRNGVYQSVHQSYKEPISNIELGGHGDIAKTFDHIYSPTLSANFLLANWELFDVKDSQECPAIDHIFTSWFWYHSHGIYIPKKLNSKLSKYANDVLQKDKYSKLLDEMDNLYFSESIDGCGEEVLYKDPFYYAECYTKYELSLIKS
jgi:hypothetical protein